ncbi:probable fructose-2,6-bisphosphatase TIGAR A isoform X2 [Fundulus heteroclitus]|uniref:probable fructose-2,6-bisphosphatase TIGAR A isoform X2 n=1 Tax=Fundulus heteroclitus TaxID=8078 RepID=UPI00165BE1D8|nr:probable fructose-2,6-bisphosphatase TIGAR A isoform X2 [Fundulus heteroclitus]
MSSPLAVLPTRFGTQNLSAGHTMEALRFGLTLVRHGETKYNKEGLLQGQAIDSCLSEAGLQQAEAAGRYLRDVSFSNVFASDMLRARQTAEKIMQQNSSCLALQMSFGTAEGGRVQDFKEMARAAGESLAGFTPPGGETQEQVKERVRLFLENMLQQMGAEHWPVSGHAAAAAAAAAAPEGSPAEGEAEDGVRGMPVHALVVTHGAYMREAVRYFVEELHCSFPSSWDQSHMFSLSPNTGICRFTLRTAKEGSKFVLLGMRCVFIHRADHIKQAEQDSKARAK